MDMNVDPNWLLRMAEKEDGRIISVGGLVCDIQKMEAMMVRNGFCPACGGCTSRAIFDAQEHSQDWCECEEELPPLGIVYCVACNGTGEDPNHNGATCSACDGEGKEDHA